MSGDAERGEVAMADKTGPTALRDTRPTISRTTWLVIVLLAFVGQVAWAVENNFLNLFVQPRRCHADNAHSRVDGKCLHQRRAINF